MKKIIFVALAATTLFATTACRGAGTLNQETTAAENTDVETTEEIIKNSKISFQKKYSEEVKNAITVDKELLYEYGTYLSGEKILTAITIEENTGDCLKSKVDNGKELFYSIIANFDDEDEISFYKEGDIVVIVGVSEESVFDGVTLNECHVVSSGEAAIEKLKELDEDSSAQLKQVNKIKSQIESSKSNAIEQTANQYKNECENVDYADVERNPDKYEDKKILVSGTVEQLIEGWFDSVTLLVYDDSGNNWYITYWRDENESRILEGDYITAYGECSGVSSYTSILGSQITIPSMSAEYID